MVHIKRTIVAICFLLAFPSLLSAQAADPEDKQPTLTMKTDGADWVLKDLSAPFVLKVDEFKDIGEKEDHLRRISWSDPGRKNIYQGSLE